MKYRVVVDHSICAGTSNCVETAPDAFALNDRGLAVVLTGCTDDEAILRGAQSCPVEAITVYDATTGERIHP